MYVDGTKRQYLGEPLFSGRMVCLTQYVGSNINIPVNISCNGDESTVERMPQLKLLRNKAFNFFESVTRDDELDVRHLTVPGKYFLLLIGNLNVQASGSKDTITVHFVIVTKCKQDSKVQTYSSFTGIFLDAIIFDISRNVTFKDIKEQSRQ